jgi:hypothetical protein
VTTALCGVRGRSAGGLRVAHGRGCAGRVKRADAARRVCVAAPRVVEVAEQHHAAALLQGKHLLAGRLKRLLRQPPPVHPAAGGPVVAGHGRYVRAAREQIAAVVAAVVAGGGSSASAAHPQPHAVACAISRLQRAASPDPCRWARLGAVKAHEARDGHV